MLVGSLCSGIGLFDLGLQRAGYRIAWQVEVDPYCRAVLASRFPESVQYDDLRTLDFASVQPVDVLCAGFPCQPASVAGSRRGVDDERWLWPAVLRAIRELRPILVFLENVPGLLAVNAGGAFGDILGGLAACRYDAEWDCLPASAFGANHQRDRLWVVAYANTVDLRVVAERFECESTERGNAVAIHAGQVGRLASDSGRRRLAMPKPLGRATYPGRRRTRE